MDSNEVKQGLRKNFFTVVLLAIAGSIIYGLAYFRNYYYDAYVATYHLTNTQMGSLGSAYGFMGLVSYLIGGVLADRFPAKKLMVGSLIATGLGGFLHLFFTSYAALFLIYALWGVTSLLTFWPALLKIVRMQANEDEQSRAYGIFEGTRGITNVIHMAVATAIFGFFQKQLTEAMGLRWIIIFYSVIPILCGLAFLFLVKEPAPMKEAGAGEKLKMKDIIDVLKMPAIWLIIGMMFTSYTFNMSIYYFTPYASNIIGTSAVFAAIVSMLAQYCRLVAAPVGGFLADKISKSTIMMCGFIVMALGTLLMISVSGMSGQIQVILLIVAASLVYLAMFSNYGLFFSFMSEGKIPLRLSGIAIGLASTLGYLPEVIAPLVAGNVLDRYEGNSGYFIYFTLMVVMAVVGAILCVIWHRTYGKAYKAEMKLKEAAQAQEAAVKE
ncbi:MFS transporter [Enterococcus hulanensis]|uniref:MFS transporter n=1 Tax=Enterococcus hulanensis TaxID=2559929 RepID=A0ABU3EYJ5_9ENTE|nr:MULTISPECIES: MFS transporter [Enterococcus]MBX8938988.1 MFS transporter [Enterococcus gilvus]MDT2599910.1 MFS transporter [Enterococcus hulanensis]MDT2609984.1 MFS transporter [Enterococcus hulanensis]MDT2617791.1 MFS transporter [Enterococcus hulanensis]MDT2630615.1 MFS transporter [Enterococcus hulanensis]